MSDIINTLPINEYHNPTNDELIILEKYFPSNDIELIRNLKISLLLSIVILMLNTLCTNIKILNNLRPDLKEVKNFIIIPWYSYIKVLTEDGVWDKLLENILYPVNATVDIMLQNAFKELQSIEKSKIEDAITGNGYETIWSNPYK